MTAPLLRLHDVSLGYQGRAVLEHISLTIERGEFVALLGPNGAGKTTLLRGILGLIPVLAGQMAYGFDRFLHPPGYVPQRDTLNPLFPLTVLEVVLMGTYARLAPWQPVRRAQRQLAEACLAQVGLAALAAQPFWALSGGQRQRAFIARGLAVEPDVLVLDEPTAGVDPGAATAILDLLAQLNHARHLTVILVSHQLRLIRPLAHTVVWVEAGRVQKGTAATMLTTERVVEAFGTIRGSE